MKLPSLINFAILSASATFALPSPILPRPGLLSIVSFYTAEQCSASKNFWAVSTGTETWFPVLKPTNGCEAINSTWSIASVNIGYAAEDCKISFYTDVSCEDDVVSPVLGECVSSDEAKWKSFSIRECAATRE
ncbi:hypothetical protein B0T22DRAFT_537129 [Podospora appendiculata]|uniref:Secreted protein n=1 Tax=Podospora appendiculata TaxID=314037 RepID=A0AAE1CEF2_9PEZI|nr:hypothetical protein B0T22DRAFT_537129 [Podospora appendiculata]